jgi:hypothetical protein
MSGFPSLGRLSELDPVVEKALGRLVNAIASNCRLSSDVLATLTLLKEAEAKAADHGREDEAARELQAAQEAAAHTFNTLIAGDDEVLRALSKLEDGKALVDEIREADKRWSAATQAFLEVARG